MPGANEHADHSAETFRKTVSAAIERNCGSSATYCDHEIITLAKWSGDVHEYTLDRPIVAMVDEQPSNVCFVIFWKDREEPMVSFYLKTAALETKLDAVNALIARQHSRHGSEKDALD